MSQSDRIFLDKKCEIKTFVPQVFKLTCDIPNMMVSEKQRILPKVYEILKNLIIFIKTLDGNNKQTSPPTRILVETLNEFYFDINISTGETIGFGNMWVIQIMQRTHIIHTTRVTQRNLFNISNKKVYEQFDLEVVFYYYTYPCLQTKLFNISTSLLF